MLTHSWIDQYRNNAVGSSLATAVSSAVQFDFGDADEIPVAKGEVFSSARPPFNNCILQFELPKNKNASHLLVLWLGQLDDNVHLICALKQRSDNKWLTTMPVNIVRESDENFLYKGNGNESTQAWLTRAHAMALNAFYILGCSNVKTIDHEAPIALNKKRSRTGKFPILTHKTLVIVSDAIKVVGNDNGGTHSSPRVHLRRGHVRRLDETRRVWVQSCVVGSKHGIVTKDYKVIKQST